MSQTEQQLAQALRAFKQNPTPPLATSIKQLVGQLRYQQRIAKKR